MDQCMTMPGGGHFEVAPGQITDDSELAMCLLNALADSNAGGNACYDTLKVAKSYASWCESNPFDVGQTVGTGLGPLT